MIPSPAIPPGAKALIGWQPLFALFSSYQAVFTGNMPSPFLILQSVAWAIAVLVIGGQLFLRHEREFAANL